MNSLLAIQIAVLTRKFAMPDAAVPWEIDVRAVKQKLDAGEPFFFLDCREKSEYDTAKIAGTTLLPMSELTTPHRRFGTAPRRTDRRSLPPRRPQHARGPVAAAKRLRQGPEHGGRHSSVGGRNRSEEYRSIEVNERAAVALNFRAR